MRLYALVAVIGTVLIAALAATAAPARINDTDKGCNVRLKGLKTLSDPQRKLVNLHPKNTPGAQPRGGRRGGRTLEHERACNVRTRRFGGHLNARSFRRVATHRRQPRPGRALVCVLRGIHPTRSRAGEAALPAPGPIRGEVGPWALGSRLRCCAYHRSYTPTGRPVSSSQPLRSRGVGAPLVWSRCGLGERSSVLFRMVEQERQHKTLTNL